MKFLLSFCTLLLCHFGLHAEEVTFLKMNATPYGQGFFSVFTSVMGLLDKYDKGHYSGFSLNFGKGGLYYDENWGPNWWGYYFMPLQRGQGASTSPCPGHLHLQLAMHCINHLSKERCHTLIKKYIRLRPHIEDKVNQFVNKHFQHYFVVGVHYRGTDKMNNEAPVLEYEMIINSINHFLYNNREKEILIFLATDEEDFMEEMLQRFPGQVVTISTIRSKDGLPIHFGKKNKYKHGEEALLDCLLLSRCDHLIRTSSNLSLCSTFFNPKLTVELLNPGRIDR